MDVNHTELWDGYRNGQVCVLPRQLTFSILGQLEEPMKQHRSEQLKPRVSLPELSSREPLIRLALLQQYEFPLQNESTQNSTKR
ncbi:unnamed protein product [Sphagnum balticum]